MKISLDISQIVYSGTGVARFTDGLVNAILENDKNNDWLFFFSGLRRQLSKELEKRIADRGFKLLKWKLPPSVLSFYWNDLHRFSSLLPTPYSLQTNPDWFISSDWAEPAVSRTKKATVIHDLVFKRYPETVNGKIRQTQTKRLEWVKKESNIIFADSEATKKDIVDILGVAATKIVVNYPGVTVTKPAETTVKQTLKKYDLTKPFILAVGKLEPRKNLDRLIDAMKQWNNEAIDLVIVGPKGWDSTIQQYNNSAISNIKFLGYVNDTELYSLYSLSLFLIYPSIWEGFGYPLVEAMKLGKPVACSNTSSIAEIAGEAALTFDPQDVNAMTHCIDAMSRDKRLRKDLIAKGYRRSTIFSWQNYYNNFIQTLYDNRN